MFRCAYHIFLRDKRYVYSTNVNNKKNIVKNTKHLFRYIWRICFSRYNYDAFKIYLLRVKAIELAILSIETIYFCFLFK